MSTPRPQDLVRYATIAPQAAMAWRNGYLTAALLVVAGGIATAVVGVQRHFEITLELDVGVPALCATSGEGDGCRTAMSSWLGKPFGVPAVALGLATHMTAFLLLFITAVGATTAQWPLVRWALVGLRTIMVVLAAALFVFAFIGRGLLGYKCEICFTMHVFNLATLVLLGMTVAAYGRRLKTESTRWHAGAAVVAVLLTAVAIPWMARQVHATTMAVHVSDAQRGMRAAEAAARLDLLRPCLGQCIEGLVYKPEQTPRGPALNFGPVGTGAYRVLALDLTCSHCRKELKDHTLQALGAAARGLQGPVQIVLRPRAAECNAGSRIVNLGKRMCLANAAFACAHASQPLVAVDYAAAELALLTEDAYLDRPRWLREHGGAAVEACYNREIANGFPLVRSLAATGEQWQKVAAATHRDCQAGIDDGPKPEGIFWCFTGLPAMAVVRPPGAVPMRGTVADPDFVRNASRVGYRWALLDPCL